MPFVNNFLIRQLGESFKMKGLLSLNVLAVTLGTWLGGHNVNAQQCIDVFHNGCSVSFSYFLEESIHRERYRDGRSTQMVSKY